MACLAAKERDGPCCIHGGAHNRTARSVNPTWQINRNDWNIAGIHCIDHPPWQSFDIVMEARAEEGVYDHIAASQNRRRCFFNRATPARRGNRSIPLQRLRLTNDAEPHKKAIVGETRSEE